MRIYEYQKEIKLDVAGLKNYDIILELLWLQEYNLTIDWSTGFIKFNKPRCNDHTKGLKKEEFWKLNELTATDKHKKTSLIILKEYQEYSKIFEKKSNN